MTTEPTRLFDRLKKGLEEGLEHERGVRSLRVAELVVPDAPCHEAPEGRAYTRPTPRSLVEP